MPELPEIYRREPAFQFTLAEMQSMYVVLRNHARANESIAVKPASPEAHRLLRIRSVVRKLEAVLDKCADNQYRSNLATEDINLDG